MSSTPATGVPSMARNGPPTLEKKPVKFSNLLLGAGLNIVTTLGQPLEVVKTTMAANRSEGFSGAIGRIWARGGVLGFYQGLIPWAWIEASTKGAVLLFVASEAEYYAKSFGAPDFLAGISGGMTGGLAQAYATMGFCTCMKTVEITKHKVAATGAKPPGTLETFMQIWRTEGLRGINRGVNAVAVRQVTNWGSRFGLSRVAETGIRRVMDKEHGEKLSVVEKITASALGGGLSAWNQPIEVIRVELQSKTVDPNRPKNLNVASAFKYIYSNNGIKGLYRGVTPRIGLGVWQTVCMVALGDVAKEAVEKLTGDKFPDKVAQPSLRGWRCDLTALSHRYNLYFLASVDEVHVYQPSFPDQNLPSEAELVLHPPKTGVVGQGIDPSNPHSITRILVDYLGSEEILLLACDDGDVIGYRIQEIQRALEHRTNLQEPINDDSIHVFLHRNVGASAWGLAVHREARIIAISANTHHITIIAYALASGSELDTSDHNAHGLSPPAPNFPYSRQKDDVFTLSATNNIPALSFYGDSGRWLLSSCIDGKTALWDLNSREEVATFQLGWCASASDLSTPPRYFRHRFLCECPAAQNVLHGAWGTIALDIRSAYESSSAEEFTPAASTADFMDITNQKERFRVSNRTSPFSESSESEYDSEAADDGDDGTDDEQPAQPFAQLIQAVSQSVCTKKPRSSCLLPRLKDAIIAPFLIFTKEDIFLVQGSYKTSMNYTLNQVTAMQRPLHPGRWVEALTSQDRHCFFSQIPELGIFIVGSPIGHAGVFSLCFTKREDHEQPRYGFKLEYLLPFHKSDQTKITGVPQGRLLGIAVAPIQGMFDVPRDTEALEQEKETLQPRRWRLLMYYMDHTVLSFELSRMRVDESPSLSDMVV
ncbi:mitochondrial carrier [Alternaria alternata]|uniref:Mitochondrial carrier n=1 Tax=Alternaria alternata TaxID=5599 RepID=A0A177DC61_ALTAL|nr:mitochondrial carrier [Alternaria alternata]OAG17414.1 mitochondrial carrier [Alternaria alternata]